VKRLKREQAELRHRIADLMAKWESVEGELTVGL
jgi:hypothetical protein